MPEFLSKARVRAVLKTDGTAFFHMDLPRPVNNLFIFSCFDRSGQELSKDQFCFKISRCIRVHQCRVTAILQVNDLLAARAYTVYQTK